MRFALKSLTLGLFLLVGGCSDSSYNSNSNPTDPTDPTDPIVEIVQPPEVPAALSVVVSATITDQLTGNIIENASVNFFENSVAATNINGIDGQSIDSLTVTDGGFQVTAENNITTFSVVVSADGYLDKIATINVDPADDVVATQLNMLAVDVEAVSVVSEDVAVGGSEVPQTITVSTDVAQVEETTEGSAQIEVPATVVLQDEQGAPVNVTSLSVDISYIESQGFDEPETYDTNIVVPDETPTTQQVYISDSQLVDDQTISLTFSYLADDANTSGLGFSVDYDSAALTFASVSNVFAGAVEEGPRTGDTDSVYFSWTSDSSSSEPPESVVTEPSQAASTQHVYVSESTKSEDGTKAVVTLSYMSDDDTTTGIGFKLQFDEAQLTLDNVELITSSDNIAGGALTTEGGISSLSFGYASLFGAWPGSTSADLAKVTFDIVDGATGSADLDVVQTSNAAGFAFDGQSHAIAITGEPAATFPGSTTADLATVTFNISEGSYGLTPIDITETSSGSGYSFVGQSQQVAIGDEPESNEESVSLASLIPEGLNSDESIEEVLVPIGVAEINMTSQDGTKIKNFSQPITITINLPADTELASGQNVQAADVFTVRSFDSEALVWTTEDNDAVVGELQNGLYPANLQVDHLTIFALAEKVTACNSAVTFSLTGDAVPDSGLQLFISSDDTEKTVSVGSTLVTISGEEAKSSGFVDDANASYQVTVKDYTGNVWSGPTEVTGLCGSNVSIELANPVQTVDETLSVNLVCSQDSLVSTPLENAVVSYRKDATSGALTAKQTAPGVYALSQMDQSSSTYLVTIDTRTDEGIVTTTVVPNGNDESYNVETSCDVATGTGTGSI